VGQCLPEAACDGQALPEGLEFKVSVVLCWDASSRKGSKRLADCDTEGPSACEV
jgi:hypothetical protein